jgi:hypothetical protein
MPTMPKDMIPPIDIATLSPPAQKIAGPGAPEKMQEMAARGIAPGIRPGEMVAVLVVLSSSERASVRDTAQQTLGKLPDQVLNGALGGALHPAVIDALAIAYAERYEIVERLISTAEIPIETVERLAKAGSEKVSEMIATNEERLLANPTIIEALYMNKRTRMSTADRLIELAVRNNIILHGIPAFREAALAIQNELILEASEEPTPDDILFQETEELAEKLRLTAGEDTHEETDEGQEVLKEAMIPLYKRIADMTISQKVRRAQLGSREERMLLVRDNNRMVSSAAVRSPMMQEDEAILISRNRNMSDEVLRVIGSTPEFTKSYSVKRNLVENPKTPISIATRLITFLRENDLRLLSKSKNVTGPVQEAARRHLDRRKG